MTIYDFTAQNMAGEEISLEQYRGKVLLVVNTATQCGFTPQYKELQSMYADLGGEDFEILDFPCNQFANQAPGSEEEIHIFCEGRFGVTFPQFAKVDVNGENAHPLFRWLTTETKFQGFDGAMKLMLTPIVKKMDKDYKKNGNIKWNFTKFLIDREGKIVARFEPTRDMKEVRAQVEALVREV